MTLDDIHKTVVAIADAAAGRHQALDGSDSYPDDEKAHGLEDALYKDVLSAIADGAPNARTLAAAALTAARLDFTRWYS